MSQLKDVLRYDPESGRWTRLTGCRKGQIAAEFSFDKNGYRIIYFAGKSYRAARLAYFYVTGVWPVEVDHIDLDKSNDKWSNLREATSSQNKFNRRVQENNKRRLKGVGWHVRNGKWRARLRQKDILLSDCPAAAHFAYIVAANKAFGEFARAS